MGKKISILIPTLNAAEYLEECINSILRQTYDYLEIIVVDAGSTDGTLEILSKYIEQDDRIRLIHSGKKSYGYQMNVAMKNATGDYIGIVEADDYIAEDMYECLLDVMIENGADYVKGKPQFIRAFQNGEPTIEDEKTYIEEKGLSGILINPSLMPELLIYDIYHWTGLYKKDFVNNICFNETYGAAFQDQGFLLKTISKAEKAVYIDKPVYYYRQNNSDSSIFNTRGFAYIYQEYSLNYVYAQKLGSKWIEAFYLRMFEQICGRYFVMAISGSYWQDAEADIELLRKWLLKSERAGYFSKCKMEREKRKKLNYFLNSSEDLYEYMKDPWEFEKRQNIKKAIDCKHAWIYGAGKIGTKVAGELSQGMFKNKVRGFVVSKQGSGEYIERYCVYNLDEITMPAKDTLFIISMSAQYHEEVIALLESKGYDNYIIWGDNFKQIKWYLTEYKFENRKKNLDKVCFVLSGYKKFLWNSVFKRLTAFVPDDVEVCILSSGIYDQGLSDMALNNGWSYLSTSFNDLTLIQNIALRIYDKAEWVYKMDEDIFLTEGCFEKLYQMYNKVLNEAPYHVGFVAPLIPLNGYGYIHILKHYDALSEYENKFEKAKFGGLQTHLLERSPDAAKFMWGAKSGLPCIDRINLDFSDDMKYSICGVRFSIGFILYKRCFWEMMGGFGVGGESDLGRDEREICYYCIIKSHAMIVAHNTVVGHFSFGPQTEAMREFYIEHPEYFALQEE